MTRERQELPYGFQINTVTDAKGNAFDEKKQPNLNYSFYLNPNKIRVIAYKGGGARGFAYEKFIQIAEDNGTLAGVEEVGGSSAGAIAAIFTAIHFDPGKRVTALEHFDTANAMDIMGNSWGWKLYKALSWPLYFFSKPLQWAADLIDWIARPFNYFTLGKIIGWPLNFAAGVLRLATVISPEGFAGIYNLITKGGIYKGDQLQKSLRRAIQFHTRNGLESILHRIDENSKKEAIKAHLIEIGLLRRNQSGKLLMTEEITFNHFYHLSQLPGSQFKQLFITGTKLSDGSSVIFNRFNDMPIHRAMRRSMSIPIFYQHDGEYIDGGCSNNFPIQSASTKKYDPFLEYHGVDDKLARLGVRVDYHHELGHLWIKAKESWFANLLGRFKRWVGSLIAGMDTYAADAAVTKSMKEDYAQRTIQLSDHGVGVTEFDLSKKRRKALNKETSTTVNAYFDQHRGEKILECYRRTEDMPAWMQATLRYDLKKDTMTDKIFPCKSESEAEALRKAELEKIEKTPLIKGWNTQMAALEKSMSERKSPATEIAKKEQEINNKFQKDLKTWSQRKQIQSTLFVNTEQKAKSSLPLPTATEDSQEQLDNKIIAETKPVLPKPPVKKIDEDRLYHYPLRM